MIDNWWNITPALPPNAPGKSCLPVMSMHERHTPPDIHAHSNALCVSFFDRCSCGNGCTCPERYLDGSLTYNQLVTFIDGIQPSAAPKCQISIAMAKNATAGDKVRVNGIAVTSDPGLISNARIGETKYMAWLLGDKWAA